MGDFYAKIDTLVSCKYYQLAQKIFSNPKNDLHYQEQLFAIKDEAKKQELQKKYEEYNNTQKQLQQKIEEKIKDCK